MKIWISGEICYFCAHIINPKQSKMKKFLAIVAIAAFMTACNDDKKTETTATSTDSVATDANMMSNMADSAKISMDKMADSAKKQIDKMADSAKDKMDKMEDKMDKKMDKKDKMEKKP